MQANDESKKKKVFEINHTSHRQCIKFDTRNRNNFPSQPQLIKEEKLDCEKKHENERNALTIKELLTNRFK